MLVEPTLALIVLVLACVELIWAVVRPLASVAAGLVIEYAPPPATDKETVWPDIGLPPASFTVTVMVENALPSAATPLLGLAVTVELAALTAPGITVITPESVLVSESAAASMTAEPTRRPAKAALLVSLDATRSPVATPPVLLTRLQVAATLATKLVATSRVMAYTVIELPAATFCAGTTVPVPSAFVSTRICVPVPPLTVMVPESVLVNEPEAASMAAVPVKCAVKVALLVSPDATRSLSATPPVLLTRLQVAAALATKLPYASRVMAYTVIELPAVTACAGTTEPLPSAAVSTRICDAAATLTVNAPLTPVFPVPAWSAAVMVTADPDLLSVTLWLDRTPAVNEPEVAGLTVPPLPLPASVKSTVPPKLVTVLLFTSCAVMPRLNAAPAVCVAGVDTAK